MFNNTTILKMTTKGGRLGYFLGALFARFWGFFLGVLFFGFARFWVFFLGVFFFGIKNACFFENDHL